MIEFNRKEKMYLQLYAKIKEDIVSGVYKADEKLPSKRLLSQKLGISMNTIQAAYDILLAEGYITSKERSGFYVNKIVNYEVNYQVPKIKSVEIKNEFLYDLTTSMVDSSLFPKDIWAKLTKEVINSSQLFSKENSNGEENLREQIAKYLYASRGVITNSENIIIGAGFEYLFTIITQLFSHNDIYVLEDPGYLKASIILNNLNKKVRYLDENEIEGNILYLTPSHQFPTGRITKVSQRNKIVNWLTYSDRNFLIEDDYDSEFRFDGAPMQAIQGMCPDKVIYISSFSRTISPAIRVSYMVIPNKIKSIYDKKMNRYICTSSRLEQLVLAKFMEYGYYERHLNKSRTLYRKKRDIIQRIVKEDKYRNEFCLSKENIGLHFILSIRKEIDENIVKEILLNKKIKVKFLSDYAINSKTNNSSLVISYSSISIEKIEYVLKQIFDIILNIV